MGHTARMTPALLMLLGCPKAPLPMAVDWTETPHLPSPTSGSYSKTPDTPEDRGVASVIGLHRWDASLSGAAAGLALRIVDGEGSLTNPELRNAAFRAGWPYPIRSAQVWVGSVGAPPPDAVHKWVSGLPAGVTIGLVRARGALEEVWVGLVSEPRIDVGVIPRQLPAGGTLMIPAIPGAEVWVADPYGRLDHGPLAVPFTRTTEVGGEWLVEIRDATGPAASFPVYVGMVPPDLGLLIPSAPPASWQEADDLTVSLLTRVRDAYGMRPFVPDALLEAAVRSAADDPSVTAMDMAPRVGVRSDSLWRWECQAQTVEGCLDAILWDVRARPGWLVDRGLLGRQVQITTSGVRLVLLVGGE